MLIMWKEERLSHGNVKSLKNNPVYDGSVISGILMYTYVFNTTITTTKHHSDGCTFHTYVPCMFSLTSFASNLDKSCTYLTMIR